MFMRLVRFCRWLTIGAERKHPVPMATLAAPVSPPLSDNAPIASILPCFHCGRLHIDEGEWATRIHRTHLCMFCGATWRPSPFPTVGVEPQPDETPPTELPMVEPPVGWPLRSWDGRSKVFAQPLRNLQR